LSKVTLSPILSGFRSSNKLNQNFAAISAELDNTLSRDGSTPNQMLAPLDMNNQRIINVGAPVNLTDAVRLQDVVAGSVTIDVVANIATIANVATLRTTLWPEGRPDVIQLLSNHTTGDGGGFFRWDSASVLNDNNGGTRVKEDATTTGRWVRQINDGWVHVSWFGLVLSADEATATANTTAMQRALNSGFNVRLPSGSFWCGYVTQSTPGQIVEGDRARTVWRHPVVTTNPNLIEMTSAASGIIWRNFRIDGNSANVAYFYNASEMVWFGTDVTIENIEFKDCQSMGARAIGPAHRYKVTRCRFENCGDWGFFANDAGLGGAIDGIIDGNTVLNFGLQGLDSVGLGARSDIGGTKIINNTVKQTVEVAGPNSTLAIECWTNSNNAVIANNFIDMAVAGDFGLSATGYGMAVTGNIVIGTTAYGIEIVDGAATVVGNITRSPIGAGIAINLNPGHSNPGDIITVTGNTLENITTTAPEFAGLVLAGLAGTTPIAVTISGNTFHGPGRHMMLSDDLTGFTVSGNTFYNTGGTSDCISLGGDDGTITGNLFLRVSAVGTGNQNQALNIGANCRGITVSSNRFVGNSRTTNGVVVNNGATDVYIGINHFSGIISNSVFSNSTSATIVVAGGYGNVGVGMNSANKVLSFISSVNNTDQVANILPGIGVYTVANLPIDVAVGQLGYASNGRKNGEGAGLGTGVLCFRDGTQWRACDTGATVAA
jgi:hypothetical protein